MKQSEKETISWSLSVWKYRCVRDNSVLYTYTDV